jgi:release factor glutamine methyltransferase
MAEEATRRPKATSILSMSSVTVADLLARARLLSDVSDSPELDVQLLLADVLGGTRVSLLAHPELVLAAAQVEKFADLLRRRQQGEPVAYLLGRKAFWDFELKVDARVLIPRPETELLVERALDSLAGRESEPLRLLDLGTGSGAIALALARHSDCWLVTAIDSSAQALALAGENARLLGVENIHFQQSSWFDALQPIRYHLVVSNPPYVAAGDPHLLEDGLPFEPRHAQVAGENGLACLRQIAGQAPDFMQPDGWLLLEHGFEQGEAVAGLLSSLRYREIRCWQDLAELDRVTAARCPART